MSFENPSQETRIEIEPSFETFIPEEFRQGPFEYFESKGQNIKKGEIKRDEANVVKEDPTAVKTLPPWSNQNNETIYTVGKKVNLDKGMVGKSDDPFYEYKIMELVTELGLPTPRPIAKISRSNEHLIVMEKVQGTNWHDRKSLELDKKGYTKADIEKLTQEAERKMSALRDQFEEAGIIRGWKLQDMIFDVDSKNKKILKVTPVDWERTTIDQKKLDSYRTK